MCAVQTTMHIMGVMYMCCPNYHAANEWRVISLKGNVTNGCDVWYQTKEHTTNGYDVYYINQRNIQIMVMICDIKQKIYN